MNHLRYVLIMVACVGMSLGVVLAQEDALDGGTLRGQVTDLTPAQNPIEGVEVKIVAQDDGKEFITKTGADGNYEHAGLPAGHYLISISKEGYDKRVGKPVMIVNGGAHFVPLKMRQKGNIEPLFEAPRDGRMNIIVKQRIVSLLELIAESVGTRYGLDEMSVKTLHRSILDSIESALKQDGDMSLFTKSVEEGNRSLIEMLLSHPGCQAAFTKHLSEVQFKDYTEFTVAWRQRDRQAVVHWITAILDKQLTLRADQREKIVQSLLKASENELFPTSMNALRLSPQQAAQLAHYRLKVSLDGVLSEAQSKVWKGLVNASANIGHVVVLVPDAAIKNIGENKKLTVILDEPAEHVGLEKDLEIVIDDIVIDQQGKQPWIQLNAETEISQKQMVDIAEAKLAAHTELLGALDERATRRFVLVTKGVVQQYIEAQVETPEAKYRTAEIELMKRLEAGEMTREQVTTRLQVMRKELAAEMEKKVRGENTASSITEHPLYQQTIKDVLSEEAFARYSEHQTERAALHQQALRDVVVACMDTQLILDDTQRETIETSALQLIPGPLEKKTSSEFMFFQLFPQTLNFEILTPWQRDEFERVFGPIVWGR